MKLPKRITYKQIGKTVFTNEYLGRTGVCFAMLDVNGRKATLFIDGCVKKGLSANCMRTMKQQIRYEFEQLGVNFLDEIRRKSADGEKK